MEVKKNLNNVQRKMLDQIYTEQFEKRAKLITQERADGLQKLTAKCLKTFLSDKEVKKMMEAGKQFYEMSRKLESKMDESGVYLNNSISKEPSLSVRSRYYGDSRNEFPEVEAYQAKTREIELSLGEKKKEMRAKIYGVAASYEEVDQEIKELLKDV